MIFSPVTSSTFISKSAELSTSCDLKDTYSDKSDSSDDESDSNAEEDVNDTETETVVKTAIGNVMLF